MHGHFDTTTWNLRMYFFFLMRIFTVIPSPHIWQIVKVKVEGNRTPEYRHVNKKDITKATEPLKFKNVLKDHQVRHYPGSPKKQPNYWNYLKKCIRVATLLHFHQSIVKFPLLFLQSKEYENTDKVLLEQSSRSGLSRPCHCMRMLSRALLYAAPHPHIFRFQI